MEAELEENSLSCLTQRVPVRLHAPWGLGTCQACPHSQTIVPSRSSHFLGHISWVRHCLPTAGLDPTLVQSLFVNQSSASAIWLAMGDLGHR